jgi:hypothetical protein
MSLIVVAPALRKRQQESNNYDYTLNLLPSCSKKGVHFWAREPLFTESFVNYVNSILKEA